MPAPADLVLPGGVAGVLVFLVGYLLRTISADRADYRTRIEAERAATKEERERAETVQQRLGTEREDCQQRLSGERSARFETEARLAEVTAELRGLLAAHARTQLPPAGGESR